MQVGNQEPKILISIRAPARGATKTTGADRPEPTNFNPRSREGSDPQYQKSHRNLKLFQSALPRGERLCRLVHKSQRTENFNPRSREGSDVMDTFE